MVEQPSLRDVLRAATQGAHARVDAAFSRFDLTCREDYADFLTVHARVVPGLEQALDRAGAGALLADWPERRRGGALLADLADLEAPIPACAAAQVDFADPSEALGGLYVLEGSRLGGAVLARRVQRSADPRVRGAVRYLAHGERRRFWPSFVDGLNAADGVRRAAAVRGAALAFAGFQAALDQTR